MTGSGYSETFSVLGSRRPRNCSAKWVNQTWPWASRMTSCGWICFRGRSYSVMTTWVARPSGRGLRGRLAVEIIADRADRDGIRAGLEPRRREAVVAGRVGDDRDRDDRARLPGADHHAFHGAFALGADDAGERVGRLRQRGA